MKKLGLQLAILFIAAMIGYALGYYRMRQNCADTVSGMLWAMPEGCAAEVDKVFNTEWDKVKPGVKK